MKWSSYQEDIFAFKGNLIVEACPGSGKTTVIEEAIKRESGTVLALAFNRHIRDELVRRLDHLPNVTVATLNGFGNSLIPGWKKINGNKVANILKYDVLRLADSNSEKWKKFVKLVGPITKLISLCKGHMIFNRLSLCENFERLCDEYDIEIPDDSEFHQCLFATFEIDQQKTKVIDFDDQIAFKTGTPYSPIRPGVRR
jgi:superfamily I DNA/RNA helicase